jgi:hypothetical protein
MKRKRKLKGITITPQEKIILKVVNNNPDVGLEFIANKIQQKKPYTNFIIDRLLRKSALYVKYDDNHSPLYRLSDSGRTYLTQK